jgi:hypothetical protein
MGFEWLRRLVTLDIPEYKCVAKLNPFSKERKGEAFKNHHLSLKLPKKMYSKGALLGEVCPFNKMKNLTTTKRDIIVLIQDGS